jgi:hypothetical protein
METVNLELPASLYTDLQSLATEAQVDLVDLLTRWAKLARQHHAWIQGWQDLRALIEQEGGLRVGASKESVVEHMRKTRNDIFEAEYAHLYR